MFTLGIFSKLFGFGSKKDAAQEALQQLEKEGVITGVEHIEGVKSVKVIDESTPDFWGSWAKDDFDEYHRRVAEINAAEEAGDSALSVALSKYGCSNYDEFERIVETFLKYYATDAAFMQAQMNQVMNQTKQDMQNAISPELLAPINGVSLEAYATIMARKTQLSNPTDVHAVLAEYNIDEMGFSSADEGWQARMRQSNETASAALMAEYGKYFAAAGQGQYGAGAQAAAGIGVAGIAGQAPAGAEPCTLEKYCEIGAAQAVWSSQGQDVNAMLTKTFGIKAVDYSNMSAYWSGKMMSDFTIAEKMTTIQAQYEAKYRAGSGGADDDLSF